MNRIMIFTGKGGVGKTSIAAAHAIKSSKSGKKTLIVSTDMAHNLEDLFDVKLGKEPKKIDENLDVYEIDPEFVLENDYPDFIDSINKMMNTNVSSEKSIEDFGMIPGFEELFSLLKIIEIYKSNKYERIIVDCAPTGETLSLLKIPELLSWYMEKLFPLGKAAMRVLHPISKKFMKIELPDKEAMNDIQKLYIKLLELQEVLKDRKVTSIKIVCIPEKMVVLETKRNYMYMNLYDFNVDGLYINRILPKDINNAFFDEWIDLQDKYIKELEDVMKNVPIYYVPWYDEELNKTSSIDRICNDVLTDDSIFETKEINNREVFEKNEKGYALLLNIPFASKDEINLYQSASDLIIKLGNYKRNIPLPNVLREYNVTSAKLEDNVLRIQFEK